jgi:hypothetical protein
MEDTFAGQGVDDLLFDTFLALGQTLILRVCQNDSMQRFGSKQPFQRPY